MRRNMLKHFAWVFICSLAFTLVATETNTTTTTTSTTTISTNNTDTYTIHKAPIITKRPECISKCGNLTVPYPFGIGTDCAINSGYVFHCNTSFNPPRLYSSGNLRLYDISDSQLRVPNLVGYNCYNSSGILTDELSVKANLVNTPFTISEANVYTVIGCDDFGVTAGLENVRITNGCETYCSKPEEAIAGKCSGVGCCQSTVEIGAKYFRTVQISSKNHSKVYSFNRCGYSFVGEKSRFKFGGAKDLNDPGFGDRIMDSVPVVLEWQISNLSCEVAKNSVGYACTTNSFCVDSKSGLGYRCSCSNGYEGNPYLDQGCQDIDECADPNNPCEICTNFLGGFNCSCPTGYYGDGRKDHDRACKREKTEFPVIKVSIGIVLGFLSLLIGISWLYFVMKKRKLIKMREAFFHQNGGLLLKQQIESNEGGVESTKIYTSEELQKATNNYSKDMILGEGGFGTVYKGIMPDKRIVAIKRSKILNKSQIEQFVNEMIILTQVNHRNVVKLLGCCLESEVPLLVYEYVSNGTLYYHIHNSATTWLSWNNRLKIAIEASGALAYLHSATSKPIIHRDVKSANILLDDYYTAKIADFGASRLVPLDKAEVNTLVQGTLGYLDPAYFHTSNLTDKSDVYSFGVVLAELLTGKKPLDMKRSEEERSLGSYILMSMKKNTLFQILDPRVVREGSIDQVQAVAALVQKCINLNSEDRPTMKEVTMELENLRKVDKNPWVKPHSNTHDSDLIVENKEAHLYDGGEERDLYTVQFSSHTNGSDFSSGQYNSENDSAPMMFPANIGAR